MRFLHIVERAYRATAEEQDDPIVWLAGCMRQAGAELDVLLRANAVNYAVRQAQPVALTVGDWQQTQPPSLNTDLQRLQAQGVHIYLSVDDLYARGITESSLIEGINLVSMNDLPELFERYDRLLAW